MNNDEARWTCFNIKYDYNFYITNYCTKGVKKL